MELAAAAEAQKCSVAVCEPQQEGRRDWHISKDKRIRKGALQGTWL